MLNSQSSPARPSFTTMASETQSQSGSGSGYLKYNELAAHYEQIYDTPAVHIIWDSFVRELPLLGDWQNASVLDLACGTGKGLHEAQKLGASTLVGIDISKEMIEECKEDRFQLHVADCSRPLDHLEGLSPNSFDYIMGLWLLNYAVEGKDQLLRFWLNIKKYLKPTTGTFVGIIQNQETLIPHSMENFEYGVRESGLERLPTDDGYKMDVEFNTDAKVSFQTYVIDKDVFGKTAQEAGMAIVNYDVPDKTLLPSEL
ncbi:hypothetical protein KCU88_g2728, partial [Aureobasidium melanogenum]